LKKSTDTSVHAAGTRDDRANWVPTVLVASANILLDDFLLFDVSKPIADTSFLEIEKSTLDGLAYRTGGGRTVNAKVIDILVTWMVNRGRECVRGGAISATQSGGNAYPYLVPPNAQLGGADEDLDRVAVGTVLRLERCPVVGGSRLRQYRAGPREESDRSHVGVAWKLHPTGSHRNAS
jgi:hypothetical protein